MLGHRSLDCTDARIPCQHVLSVGILPVPHRRHRSDQSSMDGSFLRRAREVEANEGLHELIDRGCRTGLGAGPPAGDGEEATSSCPRDVIGRSSHGRTVCSRVAPGPRPRHRPDPRAVVVGVLGALPRPRRVRAARYSLPIPRGLERLPFPGRKRSGRLPFPARKRLGSAFGGTTTAGRPSEEDRPAVVVSAGGAA